MAEPQRDPEFLAFMAKIQSGEITPTGRQPSKGPPMHDLPPMPKNVAFRPERVKDLVRFIKAREAARLAKEAGKPFKGDDLIAKFRFCNVHREDDRVTRWLAQHWRKPHASDPDLWFAMCVARCALNSIETMETLGYPVPWKPRHFTATICARQVSGLKVYGPAYMIATPNWTGPKHEFLVERLLNPLWAKRKILRPKKGDTLASYHGLLVAEHGVGSFTAAQVVADLKYVEPLRSAPDWQTWAAPGPGSRRGLNRVCLRHIDTPWPGDTWLVTLQRLQKAVANLLPKLELHAQDLQNCLCEFDKYERARLGEGKPKQLYVPHGG